ncbi:hypothetical protein J3R82DRAFT_3483 [Butyriboletus roseoflavus]|nr:hypothetical protein J3R82DRAFT_3483 [Butyriboletus roseoflavus]
MATANATPDSFKMEYHPKASHVTEYESFSTYRRQSFQPSLFDDAPWAPFLSQVNFEIAELTHQSAMSKEQINQLLKLIWLIAGGQSGFTLRSYNDVMNAWSRVIPQLMPLQEHIILVPYKKDKLKYEIYARPLWKWALDLLEDPLLTPHFMWDAQCLCKHNGVRFECFIHEPWTANRWWDIQASLISVH